MHLVILPGWQQDRTHWQRCSTALRNQNIVHTIVDLPGFGGTPYSPELQYVDDYANWLRQYLETHFRNQKLILLGHSFGGRVAVAYAATQPPLLTGLLLVGSPNLYRPSSFLKFKKNLVMLLRPLKNILPLRLRQRLRGADYQAVQNTKLERVFINAIRTDQATELQQLSLPVHLLWGEQDQQAPVAIAKEMNQIIPNSTLEVIAGSGHDLHLEKPDLLAKKIQLYADTL